MVNHLSDSTICSPNQNGFPMAQSTWLYGAGWGLRKLLNWVHLRYNGPDIYITEVRVRPCMYQQASGYFYMAHKQDTYGIHQHPGRG